MLLILRSLKRPVSIYDAENKRLDCINPGSGREGIFSRKLRRPFFFDDPEQAPFGGVLVCSLVHWLHQSKKIPHTKRYYPSVSVDPAHDKWHHTPKRHNGRPRADRRNGNGE